MIEAFLIVRNVSSKICSINGYPNVIGLDRTGQAIMQASPESGPSPQPVDLPPMGVASAGIQTDDNPDDNKPCQDVYSFQVMLPNRGPSEHVTIYEAGELTHILACYPLSTTPFYSGQSAAPQE